MTAQARHTRTKKFKSLRPSAPYAATTLYLRRVLTSVYSNSQAGMAEATGLSLGMIYRLVQGDRDPTAENIGSIIKALPRKHAGVALTLMTTFLQEIANEACPDHYVVHVKAA